MPARFQRILQLAYLAGSKYGIDRMKILHRLIEEVVLKETDYAMQSNRTSIHTLKCISAWMQDGNRIDNPFYVRLKDRQNDKEDMPAISDEGKQPSPSSFPSVIVSPQAAATEDSGGDVSANDQI